MYGLTVRRRGEAELLGLGRIFVADAACLHLSVTDHQHRQHEAEQHRANRERAGEADRIEDYIAESEAAAVPRLSR